MSIPEVQSRSRLLAFLKNFFAEKSSTSKAAPTDASYLTLGTNGDLSAERVLTAGTNISFTDGGAGGTLTIDASGGGGGGDVSVSGTPSNNEVPTWTNATTIKGEGNLTFDGSTLAVTGDIEISGDLKVGDADIYGQTDGPLRLKADTNMYFDCDDDADGAGHFYWRNGANTTVAELDESGDLVVGGTLQVSGDWIKSDAGPTIEFYSATAIELSNDLHVVGDTYTTNLDANSVQLGLVTSYIKDQSGTNRIVIQNNGHVGFVDSTGAAAFTVFDTYCSTASDLAVGGNVQCGDDTDTEMTLASGEIQFFAKGDDLMELTQTGVGIRGATPIAGLAVTGDIEASGDLTVTGNDIKGSGGTAITMDGSNNVTVAGDLTVTGGGITLGMATSYIKDAGGTNRITIADDSNVALLSPAGNAEFVVYETYCKTMSDLAVGGNVQCLADTDTQMTLASGAIQFFGKGDDLMELTQTGVGIRGATPIAGLAVTGDIEASGDLDVGGVLTVGDGDLADGNYLLKLNSDRAWAFIQYGNGSGAALKLQNVTGPNKNFIVQTNGETRFYNSSGVEKFVIENSTGDTDSAGTKNFNIEHPLKSGYRLRHTSIEGPLCDLIYRGRITLDGNEGVVDVDSQFGMTIGTYAALTKNPQVFLQNSTGWSPVRVKSFSEGILTIESQSADNDEVCWMVVATRRDTGVMESNSTDENGDLIVEFENIEEEPYDEDPIDE